MINNPIGQQAASLYQNTANMAKIGAVSNAREDQVSFGSLVKSGVEKIVEIKLNAAEKKMFNESVSAVKKTIEAAKKIK